jgi:hypothetical protein
MTVSETLDIVDSVGLVGELVGEANHETNEARF